MGLSGKVRAALLDFGNNTSVLGISNATKAKSRPRAAMWWMVFLGLGALTFHGIFTTVREYFTYPVTTTTDIAHRPEVRRGDSQQEKGMTVPHV